MGKFLKPIDVAALKHEEEVFNSQVKRGIIDTDNSVRTAHVVCGCGALGCCFMTHWRKDESKGILKTS